MRKLCYLFIILLIPDILFERPCHAEQFGSDTVIEKIEPPFWWTDMKEQSFQLMLYGKNLAEYQPATSEPDWQISKVEKTANSNYLFITLKLSKKIRPGKHRLTLVNQKGHKLTIDYELNQRERNSAQRKGFDSSDVIYLITPDRFANGDPANDNVVHLTEKIDRNNPDGRHGGDIQGIIDRLDYFVEMGITQLWLNPVLENNHAKYSYHGYSTTDYYQVDKRLGSNELYRSLSEKAKRKNIGIIKDVIVNHIGIEHWWMKDLPAADWINHNGQFSPTNHMRESINDPHGTPEDLENFTRGWFVPSMPDLNQKNQLLANYLIQNSIWWIEYANLSGIRLDTFSYSDKLFLQKYTARIMDEYPKFNLVAEEWSTSPQIVSYWQKGRKRKDGLNFELPSLMDFPLQDSIIKGLVEKESWSTGLQKLYTTLASDFLYPEPEKLVVFADNHDMSRVFTQLNGNSELTKIALVLITTLRGTPQIFYGTEVMMGNEGTDAHGIIRSDFPGGWSGDSVNGFSGKGLTQAQSSMRNFVSQLLSWRKNTPVLHSGKLTHYAPKDGLYVYFRYDSSKKVMVIINKDKKAKKIRPEDYPSMISTDEYQLKVSDVFNSNEYSLNQPILVDAESFLVLSF